MSTTQGFIMPRATTTERTAMTVGTDQTGMQVYDTTTGSVWTYSGTAWIDASSGGAGLVASRMVISSLTAGTNGVYTITDSKTLVSNEESALPAFLEY